MILRPADTPAREAPARFRERMRELGVALLLAPANGGRMILISDDPDCSAGRLASSELATLAIHRRRSPGERAAGPIPLACGAWALPLPGARRTRGMGELFAVWTDGGYAPPDLCDASRGRPSTRPTPASAREAQRVASLVLWLHEDALELDRRLVETHELGAQLGESYEELSLLYRLSSGMLVDQPPSGFLQRACEELREVAGLGWLALQLADDDRRLESLKGRTFFAGDPPDSAPRVREIGLDLMRRPRPDAAFTPMVIEEPDGLPHLARPQRQILAVWLHRDDHPLGVLFGGEKLREPSITSIDTHLCNSLAHSLSIFVENLCLYEDVQAMFIGTLHALTSSIDAKDRYTCGHSERVAALARALAAAAGLSPHERERVYLAGLVHDIGKIGVPESVLTKPGPLTPEELQLVRRHPDIGARILQRIPQMQDLIPGVLHHHERWDGQGYPAGLAGQGIPLYGRVIALADAFDAMSSNRHYRTALDERRVLSEVTAGAGAQFDPTLARVFLDIDLAEYKGMVRQHQREFGREPEMLRIA